MSYDAQQPISPKEQRRRQEAYDFAVASNRLSGYEVTPEFDALAQRHIRGEIDMDEFLKLLNELVKTY